MAFTQADIDALKSAMASGALRVQLENRSVEFRTVREMLDLLAVMETEVNQTSGSPRVIRVVTSRG